jgi:hypothetical protein
MGAPSATRSRDERKPRPRTARSTFAIGLTLSSAAGCPERWYESRQPSVATAKPSEKTAPVTGRSVTPRQSTAAIGQAIAERLFRGCLRFQAVSGPPRVKRRSRHTECEPLSRGRAPRAWCLPCEAQQLAPGRPAGAVRGGGRTRAPQGDGLSASRLLRMRTAGWRPRPQQQAAVGSRVISAARRLPKRRRCCRNGAAGCT